MTNISTKTSRKTVTFRTIVIVIILACLVVVFLVNDHIPAKKETQSSFGDNRIERVNIICANDSSRRNDQSAMIKLNDGRLAIAYSHFGKSTKDAGESSVWYQTLADNGTTWSKAKELIPVIGLGSYVPSFFKKPGGNVLVVFFVRESDNPNTSSIHQIQFSADLKSIIKKDKIIIPATGYFPIASDRLFFDKKSNRLLMPYPVLEKGPGTSTLSYYKTRILVSNNFGDSWTDSGITINGFYNEKGFGGAVEPGIFRNRDRLTVYSRNMIENIGACNLIWNGNNYEKGKEYKLNIATRNAQSTIKYSELLRGWIATYIRLNKNAKIPRSQIDIAFSPDAVKWTPVFTVEDIEQTGGFMVNEPNIFLDNNTIFISYSVSTKPGNYFDLRLLKLPANMFGLK